MKKDGFSLLECMVYCMLIAIVMMVWFTGVASFTRTCTAQADQTNLLSTVYSALDVLVRDVRKAPRNLYAWSLMSNVAFIFKVDDLFIGWEYKDGHLLRYQGNYDHITKQWSKKTKSLVLDNVQQCAFTFNYVNQNMISLEIVLIAHDKKINRIIYVLT